MINGKISIEMGGTIHAATWRVDRGMITVSSSAGIKRTQVGGFAKKPAGLARILLRELVTERRSGT